MARPEALLEAISTLLERPEGGDDPALLERTLTDGYAHALFLEAEKWRLQKQLGKVTAAVGRGDLTSREELTALARRLEAQDGSLAQLRALLVRLRQRHSAAARSVPGRSTV